MACNMYSRHKIWSPGLLSSIVNFLIKHQSRFCAVIPELNNLCSTKINLVGPLTSIYKALASRFPTFNSPEQALAVVIIRLTQSPVKRSREPDVNNTNIHLATGFHRPYRGDAPNCFLTFVSHLNAVYSNLDPNEPKPYFRSTPIIQSSGTGKTRMVYECQQRTPSSTSAFPRKAPTATPRLAIHSQTKASKPTLPMHSAIIPAGATFKWPASFVPVTRDDGLLKPLDRYPHNDHFKAISDLAVTDLPIVHKLVEGKTFKSFLTPSYEMIFDVALQQPLLDLNEQLTAMSRHLHSGQAGVPVPPVLVAFDECVEMIVTAPYTANNQLDSLHCACNYIGTLQDEYKTLCFWLVLMSTSSSTTYRVEGVGDQALLG
ncbi:hypothetical protein NDA18_006616 [Ustilago nuda]|nr:hypothetical protein NDA18_006616 [Ustilago nuda]